MRKLLITSKGSSCSIPELLVVSAAMAFARIFGHNTEGTFVLIQNAQRDTTPIRVGIILDSVLTVFHSFTFCACARVFFCGLHTWVPQHEHESMIKLLVALLTCPSASLMPRLGQRTKRGSNSIFVQ